MKNTITSKDKGYSLIELIIVIAIIAIVSAMSLVSMTIINSARAKDAALAFNSEVSELITKNKNMIPNVPGASGGKSETAKFGLMLYYEDGNYKVSQVDCDLYGSGFYKYVLDGSDVKRNETITLSKKVDVKFTGTYSSFMNGSVETKTDFKPLNLNSNGAVCVMFDKRGHCISGYGTYEFCKRNGNPVSRVTIKQNGSIVVK